MKLVISNIVFLAALFSSTASYSQVVEEFNSFNGVDEWTTNSANIDSHGGALCFSALTTYANNIWYTAESPIYDFSSYSEVDIQWSQELNIRPGDLLRLYYYDGSDLSWYYYSLEGLTNGIYFVTIPNTATQLTFDLITVGAGGRSGKYAHIDYVLASGTTTLPVELTKFEVAYFEKANIVNFVTNSEKNCDKYILEKSVDGVYWSPVLQVEGMGNTSDMTEYEVVDRNIEYVINYYKLIQQDYDGNYKEYGPISIDNSADRPKLIKLIDELGKEVTADKKGIVYEYYDDGTIIKKYK